MALGRVAASSVVLYLILNSLLLFIEKTKCLQSENGFNLTEVERSSSCLIYLRRNHTNNISLGKIKPKRKYIGKRLSYYPNSVKTFRLTCVWGDVEPNPGPTKRSRQGDSGTTRCRWKYPCAECVKTVK